MATFKITSTPTEPLTQLEVREQLGIDSADIITITNLKVSALIKAAVGDAYSQSGWFMTDASIEARLDQFPRDGVRSIRLPGGTLQVSPAPQVFYTPSGAAEAEFATLNNWFIANSEPSGEIFLEQNASWPQDTLRPADAVRIVATLGYGTAAGDVPEVFKRAMLLQIATWHEVTENEGEPLVPGSQILKSNRTSMDIYAQYSIKGFSGFNPATDAVHARAA